MTNEYHVISTTESQVWLVPAEYEGDRGDADAAEALVGDQHGADEPTHIYYEGLLSDAIQSAETDGIALLRD